MRERESHRLNSGRGKYALLASLGVTVIACLVALVLLAPTEKRPARQTGPAEENARQASQTGPSSDAEEDALEFSLEALDEAAEDAYADSRSQLEARRRVPPHPWHLERLETIANETLEQSARNLGYMDDCHFVTSSLGDMPKSLTEWYVLAAVRLVRVRKLLELGRPNPAAITPLLRELLVEAAEGYEEAIREMLEQQQKEGPLIRYEGEEPGKVVSYEFRAIGATYVLAELRDYDALPSLARSYRVHQVPRQRAPVPLAFTLYAMHRLVSSFPEDRLSAEARRLRQEYLEAAKLLPEPQEEKVTAWSAQYAESDPRIAIFDAQGKVLKGQRTVQVAIWPTRFTDGKSIMYRHWQISERGQMLFEKLEAFIAAAFPGEAEAQ